MEGELKRGTILTSEGGYQYIIVSLLGEGGQGEVYDVENEGKHFALKWYRKEKATPDQKKILDNLLEKGAPDNHFLWPEDLVITEGGSRFGYIMPLRPKEYKNPVALMKGTINPTFETLCKVAYNATLAYQKLHKMGYCYSDISFGNLFFDSKTGDVLICDNDNVSVNGLYASQVLGTPRFMAPEIVVGKAKPSRNTDLYSLAVLIFYLFIVNHPLEGEQEAKIKCMDIHAMRMIYGTNPIFIFDENDKSNRPVKGYQDNATIYWDIFPQNVKDLFYQSFTIGLKDPRQRVTENTWLDVFANLISGIIRCPNCKYEIFYDERKEINGVGHTCWNCGSVAKVPTKMIVGKNKVLLNYNSKIYARHTFGNSDMTTVTGEVSVNPNDSSMWGIKNLTQDNWTYIQGDGTQIPVPPQKTAQIKPNVKIDFGVLTAEFK